MTSLLQLRATLTIKCKVSKLIIFGHWLAITVIPKFVRVKKEKNAGEIARGHFSQITETARLPGWGVRYRQKTAPPPPSHRTRGVPICSFPITLTPLSREKNIPPYLGYWLYHWQLQKIYPIFWAFSGNLP